MTLLRSFLKVTDILSTKKLWLPKDASKICKLLSTTPNITTLNTEIYKDGRQFLRGSNNLTLNKNNWSDEYYFGSKVDILSPPKRPLSAYLIFCQENREEILKNKQSLSNAEKMKIIAEKWKDLPQDIKKPYELSAKQNMQLYLEENKKFYGSLSEEQKEELAQLKSKRLESRRILRHKKVLQDSGLPKTPSSAYALFVQSEAKKHPVKTATEFIKKVAEQWKSLPEGSKEVFEKQAEENRMRYVEELKEWRMKMLLDGNKKIVKAFEELKNKGKSLESEKKRTKGKNSAAETKSVKAKSRTPKG